MNVLSNSILVSDLHLTANPRDEYRWGLFDFLEREAQRLKSKRIYILGDLTDAKDNHSAALVNRLADKLTTLSAGLEIIILRGNHDGTDPETPYFRFLNHFPGITFVAQPEWDGNLLLLPHSRTPETDWAGIAFGKADAVLAHVTVTGALSESGVPLPGTPRELLAAAPYVYSGDIHVPQLIGYVEYVGAPYPIRFGDRFEPRCLAFDAAGERQVLHYPCLRRRTIDTALATDLRAAGLRPGDQLKVRLHLTRAEALSWEERRREVIEEAAALQVELFGLELIVSDVRQTTLPTTAAVPQHLPPKTLLKAFADREKLEAPLIEIGELLIDEVLRA